MEVDDAQAYLTRLTNVTGALAAATTAQEVAVLAVSEGRDTLRADTALFYAADEVGTLTLLADSGIPEAHLEGLRLIPPDSPLPGAWIWRNREAVWIESFEQYAARFPALAERMRAQGRLPCFAAVPLIMGDRALGVLAFGYAKERPFGAIERSFLSTLAQLCAQAFERARLLDAERRMVERFRLLAESGDLLSRSLDYETTLENVVQLAMPSLADFCFFDVREDGGKVRRFSGAHEDPDTLALLRQTSWAPSPPELDLCGLSSGRTGVHADIDRAWMERVATSPEHLGLLETLRLRSMVTVPLRRADEAIGALTLCFGRSGRRHAPDDVTLCEELARRAALAVEHARLYRMAEEASRSKDVFLGMVSHELRTPLTAILGWVSLLEDPVRRERRDIGEPLRVIRESAVSLSRLVDDMLDVSRVVAGKVRIARETVRLRQVVASALEAVAPLIEEKELEVRVSAGSEGPVVGDAQRLQQVASNLLVNAIKFSPVRGLIEISISEHDEHARLSIRDHGVGIEPEQLQAVFDVFRQVDGSITRSHGGLGLGLAIVRQLVELHGGRVHAESAGLGEGATLVVELPLAPALSAVPDGAQASAILERGALGGRVLLVVDDQREARDVVAAILRMAGATVVTASSAAEATAVLENIELDGLLSDIGMPEEDGYVLVRRLRALERTHQRARMLAVAVTAYAGNEDRAQALEAGYDLHVAKPVQASELVRRLQIALSRPLAALGSGANEAS